MKRLALLFSCSASLLCATDLADVHRVYLFKMAKGLDQFLASRIASNHLFQIVTDPKLAEAVFTDQIGEGFEMKLEEYFPSPEEDKPAPKPKDQNAEEISPLLGDTVNKLENPASNSSFGHAKGTVFLVWAKSREVVWSSYQPPKDGTSKEMDRTANDIVSRIKKDLKGK